MKAAVFEVLRVRGPMAPKTVTRLLDSSGFKINSKTPAQSVASTLWRAMKQGEVRKTAGSRYELSESAPKNSAKEGG